MARAVRSSEIEFATHAEPLIERSLPAAPTFDDVGGPVAALQRQLVDAYGERGADEKLPVAQRVAIIVGLSSALWLVIGLGVATAIA